MFLTGETFSRQLFPPPIGKGLCWWRNYSSGLRENGAEFGENVRRDVQHTDGSGRPNISRINMKAAGIQGTIVGQNSDILKVFSSTVIIKCNYLYDSCECSSSSHTFIHSNAMCRMRQFLAVLRSFFHSSLTERNGIFPATRLHQLFFHLLSPHLAIYFLVYLSILLFQSSYITPLWEFYFLPFSVHAQTNIIQFNLLSLEIK